MPATSESLRRYPFTSPRVELNFKTYFHDMAHVLPYRDNPESLYDEYEGK